MCGIAQSDGHPLGGSQLQSYFFIVSKPKYTKLSLPMRECL